MEVRTEADRKLNFPGTSINALLLYTFSTVAMGRIVAVHTRYIQNTRGFMLNVCEIIHQIPMPLLCDSGLAVDCMILLQFLF